MLSISRRTIPACPKTSAKVGARLKVRNLTYAKICCTQVHNRIFPRDSFRFGAEVVYCSPSGREHDNRAKHQSNRCPHWLPMCSVVFVLVVRFITINRIWEQLHAIRCQHNSAQKVDASSPVSKSKESQTFARIYTENRTCVKATQNEDRLFGSLKV